MGRAGPPDCPVAGRLPGSARAPPSLQRILHACVRCNHCKLCSTLTSGLGLVLCSNVGRNNTDSGVVLGALQVVQVKTPEREGYLALQLGCGSKRAKQVHGRCAAATTPRSPAWRAL